MYNFDELCTGRNFNLQAPGTPAPLACLVSQMIPDRAFVM
jgi:hypothetical protein